MARLDEMFDSNTVPEQDSFDVIPPGPQTLMIVSSELKATSKGGQMIVLEIDVQDGEFAGRKLFERLNIKNDNPKAVEIAFRTLSSIVKAVGKVTIKDTEELHNKRFIGILSVEPAKPYKDKTTGKDKPGSPQNAIKKFQVYGVAGVAQSSGAGSTPNTAESNSVATGVPSWKRKSP